MFFTMIYMSFETFYVQVQELWRHAIMLMYLLNCTHVKEPSAEFLVPKDHVDFEQLCRDKRRERLMQQVTNSLLWRWKK